MFSLACAVVLLFAALAECGDNMPITFVELHAASPPFPSPPLAEMSREPAPSCSCSDPVVISNDYFSWSKAGTPVSLGQHCTTCNGANNGAWFRINKSSVPRVILVDVCSENNGQPSMLMDVYAVNNSRAQTACNASDLALAASFRVAFGDDTACRIRFLAQPYRIYFIHGWFDDSMPSILPLTCGPTLVSFTRLPEVAQVATCTKPIVVDMQSWAPALESQVPPMFTLGNGTSTCGKPEAQSSWVGLAGERDVTYRFGGATVNMTLTIVVRKETGHNKGNSPYGTPAIHAFTWSKGLCGARADDLAKTEVGWDMSQYLSRSDNGVTSVLELEVGPGLAVAVVVTSMGGYDELCGTGAINVWAEQGSHTFEITDQPQD